MDFAHRMGSDLVLVLVACGFIACGGSTRSSESQGAPATTDQEQHEDSVSEGGTDAGRSPSCECHIDDDQALVISWDCFCRNGECDEPSPLLSAPACTEGARIDYPECGLTTLTIRSFGGPYIEVFDSSGHLVGQQISSDTIGFVCPTDPSLSGNIERAGRFPEPTCRAAECAPGYCGPCDGDAAGGS